MAKNLDLLSFGYDLLSFRHVHDFITFRGY